MVKPRPATGLLLRRLVRLQGEFGGSAANEKLACLRGLSRSPLSSAVQVAALHEALCFLRAYPDDARVLTRVTDMLERFGARPDLRRFARRLEDTGIAGTALHYPYFADTAAWLAARFPERLHVDWERVDDALEQRILDRLDPLVLFPETPGLDEVDRSARGWLAALAGPHEADGAFLARGFAAIRADPFLREAYYDELGLPLVLEPGPGTPTRTRAHSTPGAGRIVFQTGALRRARPDLERALARRPRVRVLGRKDAARMITLAREAMVTRTRDLDAFVYGDERDVRLLECEDGLAFAAIGLQPERRLPLEAVYAFLTLKNGVPIGYVLNSALFGSAEIAYNVFPTFRSAEAGHVYGWVLASVRHLFGVDSFTIYPYQLGHGNEEGLASGAWWFYQKLGFRPRAPAALALMERELVRMRRSPTHRSSRATLKRLAAHNMYLALERPRRDVIGEISPGRISLAVSAYLSRRFGSERARGELECAAEAVRRFGAGSWARWSEPERLAWKRWAPMLLMLRGVERWSRAERREAVEVVRAKGGRRESDFVARFDRHARLRAAVLRLARPAT